MMAQRNELPAAPIETLFLCMSYVAIKKAPLAHINLQSSTSTVDLKWSCVAITLFHRKLKYETVAITRSRTAVAW